MQIDNLQIIDDLLPEIEIEEVKKEEQVVEETNVEKDPVALSFYEEMKNRGYFEEKDFDGSWETLEKELDDFPNKVLASTIASFPDVSKDVLRYIATAGENITKEEMKGFFKAYFEDEPETISNLDDARNYLESYYKEQGLTQRAVTAMLDDLEDEDKLEEKAKEILSKKEKKTDSLIEQKYEQNANLEKQARERVIAIEEELNNTKWKPERIDKIKTVLQGNTINTILQDIVNNPKSLVQFADFMSYYDTKNKVFSLENWLKQAETTTVKSVKERISQNMMSSAGTNTKSEQKNPNKLMDLIPIID